MLLLFITWFCITYESLHFVFVLLISISLFCFFLYLPCFSFHFLSLKQIISIWCIALSLFTFPLSFMLYLLSFLKGNNTHKGVNFALFVTWFSSTKIVFFITFFLIFLSPSLSFPSLYRTFLFPFLSFFPMKQKINTWYKVLTLSLDSFSYIFFQICSVFFFFLFFPHNENEVSIIWSEMVTTCHMCSFLSLLIL